MNRTKAKRRERGERERERDRSGGLRCWILSTISDRVVSVSLHVRATTLTDAFFSAAPLTSSTAYTRCSVSTCYDPNYDFVGCLDHGRIRSLEFLEFSLIVRILKIASLFFFFLLYIVIRLIKWTTRSLLNIDFTVAHFFFSGKCPSNLSKAIIFNVRVADSFVSWREGNNNKSGCIIGENYRDEESKTVFTNKLIEWNIISGWENYRGE